ncbi:g-protein coupled receptor 157-like [Anaeramoeba ignava]|uniref:G-protein coupled receptor 157-like n=1 Tax=Anaeramoeba ignava TaxID=1746090 RepID=A0A9Q0LVX7_ANAIG|nr:g-protein coupled receptor 157-like [Anaeramoeba ignava]
MESAEEIATSIGASLGLIGALLIIIIFRYFRKLKLFYRKLVFILSIYDLLQSISYLLPGRSNEIICKIQYYFLAIFASTSQFWSATISLISYLKVVKEFNDKKLNKIHKWFHLIMLIPIIVLVTVVGYSHDYNNSKTYWCTSITRAFLITLYTFNWIYIIICLIFYILTMIRLRKEFNFLSNNYSPTSKKSQINQVWVQLRMSLIPLIQIIILIPGTIRRSREWMENSPHDILSIDIIHSLLITSQGFWDFWIFIIFDPEMRNKLRNCCSSSKNPKELVFVGLSIEKNENENENENEKDTLLHFGKK